MPQGIHPVDSIAAIHVGQESNPCAIWQPVRVELISRVVRQIADDASEHVHHVHVAVTVAVGDEGDFARQQTGQHQRATHQQPADATREQH